MNLDLAADTVKQGDCEFPPQVLLEFPERPADIQPAEGPVIKIEADVFEGYKDLIQRDLADISDPVGIEGIEGDAYRHGLAMLHVAARQLLDFVG